MVFASDPLLLALTTDTSWVSRAKASNPTRRRPGRPMQAVRSRYQLLFTTLAVYPPSPVRVATT